MNLFIEKEEIFLLCHVGERKDKKVILSVVPETIYPKIESNYSKLLHPEEVSTFKSKKYKARQKNYLLGRYAAKKALSEYLDNKDFIGMFVDKGVFGQPIVRYASMETPGVSLSHTHGVAGALVFPLGYPMGIDIEGIRKDRVQTMQSQFTENEKGLVEAGDLEEEVMSTVLWTAKEALSKVTLSGLRTFLKIYEVKQVKKIDSLIKGEFLTFGQYRFLSLILGVKGVKNQFVLTIVYPGEIKIGLTPSPDIMYNI